MSISLGVSDQRVDIYDVNLNFINYYSSGTYVLKAFGIRYNPTTGYIYECDLGSGWINAFDLNLVRISTESFTRSNAYCINVYQSYILIGTNT